MSLITLNHKGAQRDVYLPKGYYMPKKINLHGSDSYLKYKNVIGEQFIVSVLGHGEFQHKYHNFL